MLKHIAIIMDGNGRWAKKRFLPRVFGHQKGVSSLRKVTARALDHGVTHLTVFAFSSENWRRPAQEVSFLMRLFIKVLESEAQRFMKHGIRFQAIGNRAQLAPELVVLIEQVEALTRDNPRLTLSIAINYGGRWDILQALNRLQIENLSGLEFCDDSSLAPYLTTYNLPEPDMMIRTGGERRVSNFLIWQMANTELYFTDELWPDFGKSSLDQAIATYYQRKKLQAEYSECLD